MRRRIGSALALWALVGLGQAGCATQSRRPEAPLQFRQWKRPSGATTATAPTPAPAPDLISSLMGRSAASPAPVPGSSAKDRAADATEARSVAGDIPASSVRPRPRPTSWLFRRFNKPAPAPAMAPPGDSGGTLARFFPTLYGKGPADPARLAQAARPQGPGGGFGRPTDLSGSSVEMTRNTMPPPSDEPPLLAEGIPTRAYPKAPTPSLPAPEALADRDRPARDEQLPSHDSASPSPADPRGPDLIDALSTRLESDPPRAAKPGPDPDDAPTDPDGRATSATVEVPSPRPAASAEAGRPGMTPLLNVVLGSSPAPGRADSPRPAEVPSQPEPRRPEFRPAAFPALDGEPRPSRARTIDLPEPEFPATYHTESLRQVAREAPRPAPSRPIAIGPAPRTPLLPRLSMFLWGAGGGG